MSQGDLIQWYVNQQNEKNNYSSTAEVEVEIKRIRSLIEVKLGSIFYLILITLDCSVSTKYGDCMHLIIWCNAEIDSEGRLLDCDR